MEKLLVEFLGTFALTYVALATGNAYAIAATLALAILLGGAISGGSFNPAVTIAMWMSNKISKTDMLPYILAEVLGGFVAYTFFKRVGTLRF